MKLGVRPRYSPETPSFLKISLMSDVMVLGCAEMVPPELAVITEIVKEEKAISKKIYECQIIISKTKLKESH